MGLRVFFKAGILSMSVLWVSFVSRLRVDVLMPVPMVVLMSVLRVIVLYIR